MCLRLVDTFDFHENQVCFGLDPERGSKGYVVGHADECDFVMHRRTMLDWEITEHPLLEERHFLVRLIVFEGRRVALLTSLSERGTVVNGTRFTQEEHVILREGDLIEERISFSYR